MRRREFIRLLGGAAAAWPLAARAQQPAMPVIGYLSSSRSDGTQHFTAAFRQGLADAGFLEDRNVAIAYRFADGQLERLPALALDLVRRQVALIHAEGLVTTMVAKGVTSTIPIVFTTAFDPVNTGLVTSLNRPGGNVTGASSIAGLLGAKRLELVRELVPKPELIAALVHPHNPMAEVDKADLQQTAASLGQRIEVFSAGSVEEINAAFSRVAEIRASALLVNAATPMPRWRTRRSSGAGTSYAIGLLLSASFLPGELGSKRHAAPGKPRRNGRKRTRC
jgi:ABC-type uncharacterized transport system substrate-binding protein